MPNITMMIPPMMRIPSRYRNKKLPASDADAPSKIKTAENPSTNERVEIKTCLRIPATASLVRSSREYPVINEKYPGIRGRIQGEKKERTPAMKAADYETVSANIFYDQLEYRFV